MTSSAHIIVLRPSGRQKAANHFRSRRGSRSAYGRPACRFSSLPRTRSDLPATPDAVASLPGHGPHGPASTRPAASRAPGAARACPINISFCSRRRSSRTASSICALLRWYGTGVRGGRGGARKSVKYLTNQHVS
jgi:hypothetical protein